MTEKKPTSKKPTKDQQIKDLQREVEELKTDVLRARADYDNFRKRKEVEMVEARDKAVINFVEDLLPAIDNFELSLKMTDNKEMFIKGVEMIHKNLMETLLEHKIEEFVVREGDAFDSTLHDPVPIEDNSAKQGKVAKVLRKGYKHKDKVFRAARVNIPTSDNDAKKQK